MVKSIRPLDIQQIKWALRTEKMDEQLAEGLEEQSC